MNTLYRVMMTRPGELEPELWTNYGTPEDAEQAARGLVGAGAAIRSDVSEITGPNPEDARFVAGFEMTSDGRIERHTEQSGEPTPEPTKGWQQKARSRSRGLER